jgi:hypothetical protein
MGTGDEAFDSIHSPNVCLDEVEAFCKGVCEEANGSGQDGLECFDGLLSELVELNAASAVVYRSTCCRKRRGRSKTRHGRERFCLARLRKKKERQ